MKCLHDGATVGLGVVDLEGDEVLPLDARAVLVVDAHVLPLKAQLEELALGDGHLHLRVLAGHLRLDDVIVAFGGGKTNKQQQQQETKDNEGRDIFHVVVLNAHK